MNDLKHIQVIKNIRKESMNIFKILLLFRMKYLFLMILNTGILFAQEPSVKATIGAFQAYTEKHPVEKIYLHLDKPYYAAGEYMHFRAYLTDIHLNQENVASGIIYVELSDAKRELIKRILLYSEENEFAGQILLPDTLTSANYHLRAYTNWMRNAGEEYFYHRDIYIGNISKKKQEAPSPPFDYQVTFFPEGGRLLAGFSNKVAFKALGNDGFGADVAGTLADAEGQELLHFNSRHLGMGAFSFTPEKGKTYKATVQSGGLQKEYTLPAAEEGLAISARQDDRSVYLTIRTTNNEPESIYLIGQSRHTVCYALEGLLDSNERIIRIGKEKFPTGIAQFTLFKDSHPVSERLVFIDRKDDLHVEIIPDKEKYGDREKATVLIRVTDIDGQPVQGSFSLSVTDDKTVQPSIHEQNIKGTLLLDADLKGYIESPGWYFAGDEAERAEALDNLLCSQGWSRFVWNNLAASSSIAYPVESEFQITGRVTNLVGRPVRNASVILFSKENMPGTTTTDKDGRFGFYGFNCPDTAEFILQARTKRDRKATIGLKIDQRDNCHAQTNVLPLTKTENKRNEMLLANYTEQTTRHIQSEEDIWTMKISEVTIEAKRIPNRETIGIASYRYGGKTLEKPYQLFILLQSLPRASRGITSNNAPPILYVVDGMKMDSKTFEYEYSFLPSNMFESIEILRGEEAVARYGHEAVEGAYVFKIKRYYGDSLVPDASVDVFRPEGYCVQKDFYIPAYEKPEILQRSMPDLRTTIYWNPAIGTNEYGKTEISFCTADFTASFSYVLEGIGNNKVVVKINASAEKRDE